jgi:hypothetical protein
MMNCKQLKKLSLSIFSMFYLFMNLCQKGTPKASSATVPTSASHDKHNYSDSVISWHLTGKAAGNQKLVIIQ